MKPPKLNKLSKKELKKLYANQWKQNIVIVGENASLNRAFTNLRNTSEIYAKALTEATEQLESSTAMKESLLKIINRVKRSEEGEQFIEIPEEGDLYLLTKEEYLRLKHGKIIAEQNMEIAQKALIVNQEDKNRIREELEETLEALSRSRQLRASFQEIADRNTGEKNTIEKMAEMTFNVVSQEMEEFVKQNGLEFENMDQKYQDLSEESKDIFRVMATRIISESPQ